MNTKTLCARAAAGLCLGLAAGAASAQADASYYGVADFSYGRFESSGFYREHRFNSNSLTASFIGVNAKYGFDGGWTPGVTLEAFGRFQDFQMGRRDSDPLLSRKAFVSLASNYGTLNVGRLQTFLFDTTTRFNALGNSVAFSPAVRHIFASGALEGVQGDFYWSRSVSYISPNWEGLTANLMAGKGSHALDGQYRGASLVLSRGVYAVALSAQRVKVDNGVDDAIDDLAWQLGATYNFGIARVFGTYTQTRDRGLDVDSKLASAGVSVAAGPGNVLLQFGHARASGPAVERRHNSTSLAYVYAYDSLIDLYGVGMDDRVSGQTRGLSYALGVRLRF